MLPGDPPAQGAPFGLLSLGATSAPEERRVNMKISDSTICRNAGACERKGRMIAQFPVYGTLDGKPPPSP